MYTGRCRSATPLMATLIGILSFFKSCFISEGWRRLVVSQLFGAIWAQTAFHKQASDVTVFTADLCAFQVRSEAIVVFHTRKEVVHIANVVLRSASWAR